MAGRPRRDRPCVRQQCSAGVTVRRRPESGKPRTTDDVAIVLATLEPPPARLGVTHWSSRLLGAALEAATGKVTGTCYPRHRHEEFLQFLN